MNKAFDQKYLFRLHLTPFQIAGKGGRQIHKKNTDITSYRLKRRIELKISKSYSNFSEWVHFAFCIGGVAPERLVTVKICFTKITTTVNSPLALHKYENK